LDFLAGQPDCVVIHTRRSFGDTAFHNVGWKIKKTRHGTRWKSEIPQQFLLNQWALYIDADEFLVLPPEYPTLTALCQEMDRRGVRAVPASLVEFFPETVSDMQTVCSVASLDELLEHAPYFDAAPIVEWQPGDVRGRRLNWSKSQRLFFQHGILKLDEQKPMAGAGCKVPLVKWNRKSRYLGSHNVNFPPASDILLCLMHFKFTCDLARRTADALVTEAYASKSEKYRRIETLLRKMEESDPLFLCSQSQRYREVSQLFDCGLMKLPSDIQ
jgi:hypothetical protein